MAKANSEITKSSGGQWKFLFFSCVLFLTISLIAFVAYIFSARQINHTYAQQQLIIAGETIKLRVATEINSELALVNKMGHSPIIQEFMMNPKDAALEAYALAEFEVFKEHIKTGMIFWVNDVDKMFHATGIEPYFIDSEDPENYWYNLTLHQTEDYNFNINYNREMDMINLWVNVPIFEHLDDGSRKPIGMLGIGINLTEVVEIVETANRERSRYTTAYLFNQFREITSASDFSLITDKVLLAEHLGDAGVKAISVADAIVDGRGRNYIYGDYMYRVGVVPAIKDWNIMMRYPLPGLLAINQPMNVVFFSMWSLIFVLFIIMNVFVARSEKAMREQNLRLIEANRKAQDASLSKSNFLAKMSHEIRTPMNAIIGMTELSLREEMSGTAREHTLTIKQAGANLLSIINDILDFSKIESGKLEIVPSEYLFASLVNDVISIIRMKVIDSEIRFVSNIDSNIPAVLWGDEIRIRQIMLNILSNAVKYTAKGFVSLNITNEILNDNTVNLKIEVKDSGRGIKEKDIEKLFSDFMQIDMSSNIGIEGTGLGLSIARNLAKAMGGDISVESKYGEGSNFTILLPQEIRSNEKLASVNNPTEKSVLIYEPRGVYAKSIMYTVENLGVPCTLAVNESEFYNLMTARSELRYVFVAYGLLESAKRVLKKTESNAQIVILTEFGKAVSNENYSTLAIPVQSISVANILNGVADEFSYNESGAAAARFTAPEAKVLIVDDVDTNLTVAEGLLLPYKMQIELCKSGMAAIEAVQSEEYDLIFMDHMMPEMDGVETVSHIRALEEEWYKKIPIIALTANAVSGTKEMFINNGFNDYLSKPIDILKLNTILERWIPAKKQNIKSAGDIHGVSAEETEKLHEKLRKVFCGDAVKAVKTLRETAADGNMQLFTTTVHAMKSALGNIREKEASMMAAQLEEAGTKGDTGFIGANAEKLIKSIESIVEKISPAERIRSEIRSDTADMEIEEDTAYLKEQLLAVKTACEDYDDTAAYMAFDLLKSKQWKNETSAAIEKIHNLILMRSNFDGASAEAEKLLSAITQSS